MDLFSGQNHEGGASGDLRGHLGTFVSALTGGGRNYNHNKITRKWNSERRGGSLSRQRGPKVGGA